MSDLPKKRKLSGSGDKDDLPNKKPKQNQEFHNTENNNESTSSEVPTTTYSDVYWLSQNSTWVAQIQWRKKAYYIGQFETDTEAARAVNKKCRELGIRLRNPELENDSPKDDANRTSKYVGVSWGKREGKWLARFTFKGKPHFVGYFDDEVEAAAAINGRCQYLNIPLKNDNVGISHTNTTASQATRKSKYTGVHWNPGSKMWVAELVHNGQKINLGSFSNEMDAGITVNNECRNQNIPLKNPDLAQMELSPRASEAKTSQYKHVNWDRTSKKWRAQMSINGVQTYIGLFKHERDAALAVNQKCIELGLEGCKQVYEIQKNALREKYFSSGDKD
jgi:hypothetical protein